MTVTADRRHSGVRKESGEISRRLSFLTVATVILSLIMRHSRTIYT